MEQADDDINSNKEGDVDVGHIRRRRRRRWTPIDMMLLEYAISSCLGDMCDTHRVAIDANCCFKREKTRKDTRRRGCYR